jgi:hypothetical protein
VEKICVNRSFSSEYHGLPGVSSSPSSMPQSFVYVFWFVLVREHANVGRDLSVFDLFCSGSLSMSLRCHFKNCLLQSSMRRALGFAAIVLGNHFA